MDLFTFVILVHRIESWVPANHHPSHEELRTRRGGPSDRWPESVDGRGSALPRTVNVLSADMVSDVRVVQVMRARRLLAFGPVRTPVAWQ